MIAYIYNKVRKTKQILLSSSFLLITCSYAASAKDIKGTVTDAATGKPIAGVSVEAYGDNRHAAMTTADGSFSLSLPDNVTSLFVHAEGMQSQQVALGKASELTVRLYSDVFMPDYTGKTTASRVSGSADFDNNVELSIDPFIQQRLSADVRTISRGGTEGVGNAMFVAGLNSLNANAQPLIVVDGMILDMQYDGTMLHDGYFNNMLANINVNDIAKVEVLKNGTALYGGKAANGVILITTKRNRSMATKIDVTIGMKYITQPRTAQMMGAEDFRTYASGLLSTEVTDVSSQTFLNTDKSYYYYNQYHNNTNWKDVVYQNSWAQKYGINVQGGDDVANYNLSVGYMLADTPLKENDASRFDMRLNTDINILKRLHLRFDASFSDVKRNLRDQGLTDNLENSIVTSTNSLALLKSPFLSQYAYDKNGNISEYLADADNYLPSTITTNDKSLPNPKAILDLGSGENRNTFGNRLVQFNVTPSYEFNKNWKVSELFNFTLANTNENYYLPIEGVTPSNGYLLPGTTDLANPVRINNMARTLAARQISIQSDTRVDWNKMFGAHSLNFMGGVRLMTSTYTLNIQNAYNTGSDKTPNNMNSYKSTAGADSRYTDITWYVIGDYNWAQRWYVNAGISAMASSRFGKDADALKMFGVRWGLFPSVQGSWVMSNEPWFNAKHINYLRFNLGYDITGNDDIDYTAARTYFQAFSMLGTSSNNNTIDGKVMTNVGNDKLQWETTRRITAGMETKFFNNRFGVKFNFFKSYTNNLLELTKMAWVSGMSEMWDNTGKLENTGFDVSLNAKLINTRNWHWEAGFSLGHYKNKVTQLGSGTKETTYYGATILTSEGNPLGLFYGYQTNGVYATTADANADGLYQLDESGQKVYFQAGDMRFRDLNGDGMIDENDRTVIGNPNPDCYGNIYSSLNFKRWQLDLSFNYSIGNDIYNYERSILESGKYFYNQTTAMNSRWMTEGQVTSIPRAEYQDPHGNSRFSDRWIEDGSYLRLSNVTLSYYIPINNVFIQGVTVWGAAQNLFTISKYLGSNPDCTASGKAIYQGIDRGISGISRSFSMGVKVNL